MGECRRCFGIGELEDDLPMGRVDVYDCPSCDGTGLTEETRKEIKAQKSCDTAWEKNR